MRAALMILALSVGLSAAHAEARQIADSATAPNTSELDRLTAEAEAIDPVQNAQDALDAWIEAYDAALKLYDADDPRAAMIKGRRIDGYFYTGELDKSADLAHEVIAILDEAGSDYAAERATMIYNLGSILEQQGKTAESYERQAEALALRREIYGDQDHDDLAASLGGMAIAEYRQGRFLKASELMGDAVAMRERIDEPNGTLVALKISYAAVLRAAGDLDAAIDEALETARMAQENLPADHPYQALVENNLAVFLQDQGRYEEAEPVIRRAIEGRVASVGRQHPQTAMSQSVLAYNLLRQGKLEEAKTVARAADAVYDETVGETADALVTRSVISEAMWREGRHAEALALQADIVAKLSDQLEPANRDRIIGHDTYADFLEGDGRIEDALAQRRAAQAGREATLPADHHARLTGAVRIGALEALTRDPDGLTRAADAAEELQAQQQAFVLENFVKPVPLEQTEKAYAALAEAAAELGENDIAFEAAQAVWASDAATALAKASARLRVEDSDIAALLRDRQDLAETRAADLAAYVALTGSEDSARLSELGDSIAETETRLKAISEELTQRYPDFVQLERPPRLTLAEAQSALAPGEVLLAALETDRSVIVFAISPDAVHIGPAPGLSPATLDGYVASLRRSLDSQIYDAELRPEFDAGAAYALYGGLFGGGTWDVVSGAQTLLTVTNGSLGRLPLSVLLTEKPADGSDLRGAGWLIRHFNIATLPAIGALTGADRRSAAASDRFFGAGAPKLAENEDGGALGNATRYYRGATADLTALRDLPSLPGAAEELRDMAAAFGAENATLLIGADATESAVRQSIPADASVIAFATHGLVSGELRGLAEPALVFTPPETASEDDDGLLTVSEITPLRLNADWVILSACNTAAGRDAGAPGLTGLARAFIYAGGRNLLASHWRVRDDAAARLTVDTVRLQRGGLSPAGALRQAQLDFMDDAANADGWRPGVWAPFVLIGR